MLIWTFSQFVLIWQFVQAILADLETLRKVNDHDRNCAQFLFANERLPNDRFSASSHRIGRANFKASYARLLDVHSQVDSTDGLAWCPLKMVYKHPTEWIQVDLGGLIALEQLYTVGRGSQGHSGDFTPEIILKYQRAANSAWITYRDSTNSWILPINTDSRSKQRLSLSTVLARRVRLYALATASGPSQVCLKFALVGCVIRDEVDSYSAPGGDLMTSPTLDLSDHIYDGIRTDKANWTNGMGVLMDNKFWSGRFSVALVAGDIFLSRSLPFTGWHCSRHRRPSFISLQFHFSSDRFFKSLKLYALRDWAAAKVDLIGPIVVRIDGAVQLNETAVEKFRVGDGFEFPVVMELTGNPRGRLFEVQLHCGTVEHWVLLSEVLIDSVVLEPTMSNSSNDRIPIKVTTQSGSSKIDKDDAEVRGDRHQSSTEWATDNDGATNPDRTTFLVAITMAIVAVLGLIFVAVALYRARRRHRHHKAKTQKLEVVAHCKYPHDSCTLPSGTIFTIHSKSPSQHMTPKVISGGVYSGGDSQSSDGPGVYATWPNTDDDASKAVASATSTNHNRHLPHHLVQSASATTGRGPMTENICLLGSGGQLSHSNSNYGNKEYATYMPSGTMTTDPSALMCPLITGGSPLPLPGPSQPGGSATPVTWIRWAVPPLTSSSSSTPVVPLHLLDYRGVCGDVDLRYDSSHDPQRQQQQPPSDANIRLVPARAILPAHHTLACGQYGSVQLSHLLTGVSSQAPNPVIIKAIDPGAPQPLRTAFIREVAILSRVAGESLPRLLCLASTTTEDSDSDLVAAGAMTGPYRDDAVTRLQAGRLRIVLPTPPLLSLKRFLQQQHPIDPVPGSVLVHSLLQVAAAMHHLSTVLGVCHRDLGTRTCGIDPRSGHLTVSLGGGCLVGPASTGGGHPEDYCHIEFTGAASGLAVFPLRYMAPEALVGPGYSSTADVWAMGLLIWETVTLARHCPYASISDSSLLDLFLSRSLPLPHPGNRPSPPLSSLIDLCISPSPARRPSFAQIHTFLSRLSPAPDPAPQLSSSPQIFLPAPPPYI